MLKKLKGKAGRTGTTGPVGPAGAAGAKGEVGPKGETGAAGSAVACAHVLKSGVLDTADSKNVSAAYEDGTPGLYCPNVTVPFSDAVASVDSHEGSGWVSVQRGPEVPSECGEGAANVIVLTSAEKEPFSAQGFYISFN